MNMVCWLAMLVGRKGVYTTVYNNDIWKCEYVSNWILTSCQAHGVVSQADYDNACVRVLSTVML